MVKLIGIWNCTVLLHWKKKSIIFNSFCRSSKTAYCYFKLSSKKKAIIYQNVQLFPQIINAPSIYSLSQFITIVQSCYCLIMASPWAFSLYLSQRYIAKHRSVRKEIVYIISLEYLVSFTTAAIWFPNIKFTQNAICKKHDKIFTTMYYHWLGWLYMLYKSTWRVVLAIMWGSAVMAPGRRLSINNHFINNVVLKKKMNERKFKTNKKSFPSNWIEGCISRYLKHARRSKTRTVFEVQARGAAHILAQS